MTQPPDDNLKALWQGQQTERAPMSVEAIRVRAEALRAKNRRARIIFLAINVVIVAEFAHFAWLAHDPLLRTGHILAGTGALWLMWRVGNRPAGPVLSPDADAGTVVDHHIAQLRRQTVKFRAVAINMAPFLTGAALIMVAIYRRGAHGYPFLIIGLLAFWTTIMWAIGRRGARRIEAQIADLEASRQD